MHCWGESSMPCRILRVGVVGSRPEGSRRDTYTGPTSIQGERGGSRSHDLGVEDLVDIAGGDGVYAIDLTEVGGEVGDVGTPVDLQGDSDVLAGILAAVYVHVGDLEVARGAGLEDLAEDAAAVLIDDPHRRGRVRRGGQPLGERRQGVDGDEVGDRGGDRERG